MPLDDRAPCDAFMRAAPQGKLAIAASGGPFARLEVGPRLDQSEAEEGCIDPMSVVGESYGDDSGILSLGTVLRWTFADRPIMMKGVREHVIC